MDIDQMNACLLVIAVVNTITMIAAICTYINRR
jgi:hypothetical protein